MSTLNYSTYIYVVSFLFCWLEERRHSNVADCALGVMFLSLLICLIQLLPLLLQVLVVQGLMKLRQSPFGVLLRPSGHAQLFHIGSQGAALVAGSVSRWSHGGFLLFVFVAILRHEQLLDDVGALDLLRLS
jgi:hypothetical protein